MFSHLDCALDKAYSVSEALEMISQKEYDLLLLDYNLPGNDGLAAIKEIKTRGFEKPIVITTTEGNEKKAVEFMKAEVHDCLVKDEQYPRIVPYVISQVLEKDRLRKRNEELARRALETEKLQTAVKTIRSLNHEISNALMTVLGNAQLLQAPKYELSAQATEKVKLIEESALRIKEIGKKLSNLVRLQWRERPNGQLIDIDDSTRWRESSQATNPISSSSQP